MTKRTYLHTRIWPETLDLLRKIAAAEQRSIVATIHALAVEKWRKIEKKRGGENNGNL